MGEYDALSGMSFDEIASRTRSQHKSQGVRENHRLGDVAIRYYREASRLTPERPREQESSLLDGLPLTSRQSSNGPGGDAFAREFDARSPASAIPFIARHAPRAGSERARYDRAGIAATGLAFEAIAPRPFVAIGDSIVLDYALHNRGTIAVRIDSAAGSFPPETVAPGRSVRWKATLRPARRLEPWWLQRPRVGDMFADPPPTQSDDELAQADWPRIRVSVAGLPQPVAISARPVYRLLEGFYGDTIAPLVAAPGLTVTPAQAMAVAQAGSRFDRNFYVTVRSSFDSERRVTVDVELPRGLSATPSSAEVVIPAGARRTVAFRIAGSMPPGAHRLRLRAKSNGEVFDESVRAVAYPHVFPQAMYAPAGITLHAVPVDVPAGLRVGYIAGKADFGPQVLTDLGVPVTLIEPAEIPRIDLSRFSVIIVGPRMYEASADLAENNGRLMEYAGNGGRLVVQYGQYLMSAPGILPYRITITRPPDRVTDEKAIVTITDPAARELTHPNQITPADFDGWVQDRATFMPDEFDPRYRTMLAMNDPGEQPVHTAILVAPVGKGTYVYTTLALFRQLEEGLPGAVRLFVNLLTP